MQSAPGRGGPNHLETQQLPAQQWHMRAAADQDSSQDAFLQPQVSHSSPIRRRSKGSSDSHQHIAASADLADLVRDYNALSARCQASEQQLARAKRELSKERQRSRQLRASYDALNLSAMQLQGRQLHQHSPSTAGSLQEGPAHAGQHGSLTSSSSSSQERLLMHASNPGVALQQPSSHPLGTAPMGDAQAGGAEGRYYRRSTDTEIADQGSNSSSMAAVRKGDSSTEVADAGQEPQPAWAAPGADMPAARLDRPLKAATTVGAGDGTAAQSAQGVNGATEDFKQGSASSSAQTSPTKRAAQPDSADSGSSASGSPKKHKQAPPAEALSTSCRPNLHSTAVRGYGAQPRQAKGAVGEAAAAAGAIEGQQQQQQRLLSKRPAQQFTQDPSASDQPLVRAARRLRTAGRSYDSSNTSRGKPEDANSADCQPSTAGAPGPGAGGNTAVATAAARGGTRAEPGSESLQQPAAAESDAAGSVEDAEAAAAPQEVVRNTSSRGAGLPPAPYSIPAVSASHDSSSYKCSRLSAVTDSNALAIVPVTATVAGGSYHSRYSTATERSQPSAAAAAPNEARFDIPEPIPEQEAAVPQPSSSSYSSYRRRAAKAAKAVAKKLKKLFVTATTASGSHSGNGSAAGGSSEQPAAPGSNDGGQHSSASSRTSSGRDSDFRRSWKGPFFSSGAAARAAAAQDAARQSKDDSHADTERQHSKASKRWKPPKWARKYGGYSSSDSSSEDEADNIFRGDPFGPAFSPLRANFSKRFPQQGQQGQAAAAAGATGSPFMDPFGPAFSPLRQSMGFQPSKQQQQQPGGCSRGPQQAGAEGDDGFGPDWLGID